MFKFLANFLIGGFLTLVFQALGGIEINPAIQPTTSDFLNQILVAGTISLVFTVVVWIFLILAALLDDACCSCGLMFLSFLFLIGPVGFWAVDQLLSGWVTVHPGFWPRVIMGAVLFWVQIPTIRS